MIYQVPSVPNNIDDLVIKAAKIKGLKKNAYIVLAMGEHAKETIEKDKGDIVENT